MRVFVDVAFVLNARKPTLNDRRLVQKKGVLVDRADCGGQYSSLHSNDRLAEAGIGPSVGWVDWLNDQRLICSIENVAPAEAEESF